MRSRGLVSGTQSSGKGSSLPRGRETEVAVAAAFPVVADNEPVGIEAADIDAVTNLGFVLAAHVDVRQQALAVRETVEDDHVGHLTGMAPFDGTPLLPFGDH